MDRSKQREIDTAFFAEVGDFAMLHDGLREVQSLEELKNTLFTLLIDHLKLVEGVDQHSEDYMQACIILSNLMNIEIDDIPDINFGDEVVSADGVVHVVIDGHDEELQPMERGLRLKGTFLRFMVMTAPILSSANNLPEEYHLDPSSLPVQPFGLYMVLEKATLLKVDGTVEHSVDEPVAVPMGPWEFPMKRVV